MYIDTFSRMHVEYNEIRGEFRRHPLIIFIRTGRPFAAAMVPEVFNRLNDRYFNLRFEQVKEVGISYMNARYQEMAADIKDGEVLRLVDKRQDYDLVYFMPYEMFDKYVGFREYYEQCDDLERKYESRRVNDYE